MFHNKYLNNKPLKPYSPSKRKSHGYLSQAGSASTATTQTASTRKALQYISVQLTFSPPLTGVRTDDHLPRGLALIFQTVNTEFLPSVLRVFIRIVKYKCHDVISNITLSTKISRSKHTLSQV